MRLVEAWERKMKKAGHQFAKIKTKNAIFDRVAIIANLPTLFTVQYPRGSSRSRNLATWPGPSEDDSITIKQENISKRDIRRIQYYKD